MQIRIFGPTVASFGVIGTLAAGLVAFRIPSEYASSAVLQVQAAESRTEVKKLLQDTLTQSALETLITNEKLYDYQGDSDARSIYNVVSRLRQAITVQRVHNAANSEATTLEITFTDRDPLKAQRVA